MLTDQQKRYLTLRGNPVHSTFAQAVAADPMTKAAVIATIFNFAASGAHTPQTIALNLGGSAVGYLVALASKESWFQSQMSKDLLKKANSLCFDTQPDGSVKTSPAHLETAEKAKWNYRYWAGSFTVKTGLVTTIMSIARFYNQGPISDLVTQEGTKLSDFLLVNAAMPAMTVGCGSIAAAFACAAHRFSRVTKPVDNPRWVITEMPKKQEQEQKSPAEKPAPLMAPGITS